MRSALLDVVVPVYNEEAGLERSIRRLHRFLSGQMPFTWRIIVADNASVDNTLAVARALALELPGVEVLHLPAKGRGRALRAAWSASRADVLCYMDVDLSTDLRALLPLVAGLISGHSDVAIGSRLARGARHGLRIHEVPVDWVDDPDSRVKIISTAIGDLKGVARMRVETPLVRFLLVGVASTLAYATLYLLLVGGLGPGGANAVALAVIALANTHANRRFTFRLRGRSGSCVNTWPED